MEGQQHRVWFPAKNANPAVPHGYAVEFGTGRLVPVGFTPQVRAQGSRPTGRGG